MKRTRDASDATVGAMVIVAGAQTMTGLWQGIAESANRKRRRKGITRSE